MPNTLAHFGAQGFLNRFALPSVDPKIVCLGCLLPDVPWIVQRLTKIVYPAMDPYTLRLYVVVQASLLVTLLLCGAIASLASSPSTIFGILGANAVIHLLFDSLQIKWANGVHLFAPFSWELLTVGWFWPESFPTYLLTAMGLGYVGWQWNRGIHFPWPFRTPTWPRMAWCLVFLAGYLCLPVLWLHGPLAYDNHFVRTLRDGEARTGKLVEFDRNRYVRRPEGDVLRTFAGEELFIANPPEVRSGLVSVKGRFVNPHTIRILDIHDHSWWFRDGSTVLGIVLLLGMWLKSLYSMVMRPFRLSNEDGR